MINSLYLRLNLTVLLVLVVFLTATGAVLDNAFLESARASLRERMMGQLYQLLATSAVDDKGSLVMPLPTHLPYPQLALPDSGMYAFVANNGGNKPLWLSPSLNKRKAPAPFPLQVGEKRWLEIQSEDRKPYYLLGFGYQRTLKSGIYPFNFYLMTDLTPLREQVSAYRQRLWAGLAGVAILLLATQTWLLHWGLRPLRKVRLELNAIESGEHDQINGRYPREVEQLTDNINNLLRQERARQTRYRNALADLAHSLKTPLAVLRNAADQPELLPDTVSEQSLRMMRIVERQLQRAGAANHAATTPPITIVPIAARIIASLHKVYRNKDITVVNKLDAGLRFRCDEADLIEILGNLLDNAFKWCRTRIEIHGYKDNHCWVLSIHDDGPGIDAGQIKHILQRGGRADESTPGQGLGLSVVAEIVEAYEGKLHVATSGLGGAAIIIEFYG